MTRSVGSWGCPKSKRSALRSFTQCASPLPQSAGSLFRSVERTANGGQCTALGGTIRERCEIGRAAELESQDRTGCQDSRQECRGTAGRVQQRPEGSGSSSSSSSRDGVRYGVRLARRKVVQWRLHRHFAGICKPALRRGSRFAPRVPRGQELSWTSLQRLLAPPGRDSADCSCPSLGNAPCCGTRGGTRGGSALMAALRSLSRAASRLDPLPSPLF